MRTRDLRNDTGTLTGIEISNIIITRRAVERVVSRISGVVITKSYRPWRWSADDDFVHFTLNGRAFVAWEPWGDSDAYWIFAQDAKDGPEVSAVKRAFEQHRVWRVI